MTRKRFLATATTTAAGLPFVAHRATARVPATGKKPPSQSTVPPRIVRADEGMPYAVLGTKMTHKLTGTDTDGQMMWLEDHNPPGAQIPPHVHTREDEVFRVLEGEVEFVIGNGDPLRLGPGDIAFAPRDIPHSWKVVSDTPARTIMTATPAGIEHMFAELGGLPEGPPDFPKVAEICARYGITFI